MGKKEFLDILEDSLKMEVSESECRKHIAYYRNYIETEIGKGRTEEEVLEELEDPRLIAKTIIETQDRVIEYRELEDIPQATKWDKIGKIFRVILLVLVTGICIWLFLSIVLPLLLLGAVGFMLYRIFLKGIKKN